MTRFNPNETGKGRPLRTTLERVLESSEKRFRLVLRQLFVRMEEVGKDESETAAEPETLLCTDFIVRREESKDGEYETDVTHGDRMSKDGVRAFFGFSLVCAFCNFLYAHAEHECIVGRWVRPIDIREAVPRCNFDFSVSEGAFDAEVADIFAIWIS